VQLGCRCTLSLLLHDWDDRAAREDRCQRFVSPRNGLPTGEHHVQLDLSGDGLAESAFAQFFFAVADQDREDLRWYLEDYPQYPIDPAPQIAQRVEQRMRTLGGELFTQLFDSIPAATRLWARLEPELPGMRVEVASEVDADVVLPWELFAGPPQQHRPGLAGILSLTQRRDDLVLVLRAAATAFLIYDALGHAPPLLPFPRSARRSTWPRPPSRPTSVTCSPSSASPTACTS
jgi:hypothetical protein